MCSFNAITRIKSNNFKGFEICFKICSRKSMKLGNHWNGLVEFFDVGQDNTQQTILSHGNSPSYKQCRYVRCRFQHFALK